MTVTIVYDNGASETFTDVTGYVDNGSFVEFTGKLTPPGTTSAQHKINWSKVRRVEKSTPPSQDPK